MGDPKLVVLRPIWFFLRESLVISLDVHLPVACAVQLGQARVKEKQRKGTVKTLQWHSPGTSPSRSTRLVCWVVAPQKDDQNLYGKREQTTKDPTPKRLSTACVLGILAIWFSHLSLSLCQASPMSPWCNSSLQSCNSRSAPPSLGFTARCEQPPSDKYVQILQT